MSVKQIGPKTWVGGLAGERRAAAVSVGQAAKGGAAKSADGVERREVPQRTIDRLGVAGVPEKVAAKHAEHLKGAAADVAAVSAFASTKLEPWRARAFTRIVEQFYKALGAGLDAAPPEARAELAKASVSALRHLVTKLGPSDALTSATSAAVGLFELGTREAARGVLTTSAKEWPNAMKDACAAVLDVADKLSSRTGLGTALNIYPVLVEQLERTAKQLTPEQRRAGWSETTKFLAETAPLDGLSQDDAAKLAQALQGAIEAHGADRGRALTEATATFRAKDAPLQDELLQQLGARRIQGIRVDVPGRPAFDRLSAALEVMAKAHPNASEATRRSIYDVRARAVELLGQIDPKQYPTDPWPAIATLVERLGPTEHGAAFLRWLEPHLAYYGSDEIASALVRASQAEKPGQLVRAMVEADLAMAGSNVEQWQGLGDVLTAVSKLPTHAALSWAFAQAPAHRQSDEFLVEAGRTLVDLARAGGRDDLPAALGELSARTRIALPNLRYYELGGADPFAEKVAIASAMARASAGGAPLDQAAWPVTNKLQTIHAQLPRAELKALIGTQPGDRPGLWGLSDASVHRRHDADMILGRITAALARTPVSRGTPEVQTDAARFAMHLTDVLTKLDGAVEIPLLRIEQDVEKAFNRPTQLHWALRGKKAQSLRSGQKPGVPEFLAAHPEYPLELAMTAGRHLSPEQGAWLIDRLQKAVGRDTRRQLRDFVFACVTAEKKPLIDALMTTEAPQKAVTRTMALVARAYREGKLGEVPWPELLRGFRAGKDPVSAIEQKKVDASLAQLGLNQIPQEQLDPRGLEEIAKVGEPISYLMEYFQPGQMHDGIDASRFRTAFLGVLEAVARGNWPAWRYENDSGKRQMSVWTPGQQAIWREETVTPMKKGDEAADVETRKAFQLSKGLAKALRRDAKLAVPGLADLGWNKASLAKLEARHAELAAAVREVPKGSREHAKLGAELGAVRDGLALLRLHYALQGAGEQPAAALLALRDPLRDAMAVLRKQKLEGVYAAAVDIDFAARDLKTSPRQGTYAVDEDGLDPLLTSTTGGCIHYASFRRWALSSLSAHANEKIIRVYDGDNFVYRALMRFHDAEIGNYKGPVLWINMASVNGGGSEEHRQLVLRHALAKGKALGVPVVANNNDFTQAAEAMKLQQQHTNVKLKIDGGITDAIFTDYTLGMDVRSNRGAAPLWEVELGLNVVMPR